MDALTVGKTIASLRHGAGMTQAILSDKLGVSDKTVSKWENGQGFPDVTLFPLIASIFGVSVDYLMNGSRRGIAIAGNIVADVVKNIDVYPDAGMLAYVSDISTAVGGCVPNTAIDLVKIDRSLSVSAIGRVGEDENGRYIVSELRRSGVNVDRIRFSDKTCTSFCDVMSMPSGERTFFHKKGANAEFSPDDIDLNALNCDILHIGYILLLDRFDEEDHEYGTVMARFLSEVQKRGIKTSIDVVSDSTADYKKKIAPVLKYCDYAIMNEIEATSIWNLDPRHADGTLDRKNIQLAMEKMVEAGVSGKVVIHCREACFSLDSDTREFTTVGAFDIPLDLIRGRVGAGDAFCAGCLYGLYNSFSDREMLEFATGAASCNLFEVNSVDGMRTKSEIMNHIQKMIKQTGFIKIKIMIEKWTKEQTKIIIEHYKKG